MYLTQSEVNGHIVALQKTDPRHLEGSVRKESQAASPTQSFGDVLAGAFNRVNDLQVESTGLGQQMIKDPDSVNIHDITIAMAEANLSLSMAKAVVDRSLKAYNEIINIR